MHLAVVDFERMAALEKADKVGQIKIVGFDGQLEARQAVKAGKLYATVMQYQVRSPRVTLTTVKWHPTEPAEDFSFFDVRLFPENGLSVDGLIYYPHPETKPEHFQQPDVLELLFPYVRGISYATDLQLAVPSDQMLIEETSRL